LIKDRNAKAKETGLTTATVHHSACHAHASHPIDNGTPITLVSATLAMRISRRRMFMPMLEPSESSGRKQKKKDEWSEVNWLPTLAPSRLPTRRTIASEAKEALFGDLLNH
jgi:hypothetical protein